MQTGYNLKYAVIILCFCIFKNATAYSQAEYTDLVKDYVKINEGSKKIKDAKIKSLTVIFVSDNLQDTLKAAQYDNNGYVTGELSKRDTSSGKKGEYEIKRYSYIYKDNLLTEKIDISGSAPRKHYITYDELSNISKEVVKEQGTVVLETEYEYDNLSRLIESSSKDILKSCKIIESYSYDSYNNLAKKSAKNECLGSKTKPVNTIYTYKYDSKGRIIEKQATYPNAGYQILTYKYGASGEIIETYTSEGADSYENTVYTYDDKTFTAKIEKNEIIGELTKKITGTIKNDKFGNKLEEKYFDSNGKLLYSITVNYEYY